MSSRAVILASSESWRRKLQDQSVKQKLYLVGL